MRSGRMLAAALMLVGMAAGCGSREERREYELVGQIVAVRPERLEVTIKHQDIPGFMPGMTMPFKVRDQQLLQGRVAGDLVRATLVLEGTDAHLSRLERTGHAPLAPADEARPPMAVLEPGAEIADAELVDDSGAPLRVSSLRGTAFAVTFVYTRCPVPNFCPLMDRHFKRVQERILADTALTGRVRLLSVSFDPDYDTPEVLARHGRKVGADRAVWSFLTGPRATVEPFAGQFGVSLVEEGPSTSEIVHNLRTAVIDRQGRLVTIFNGGDWTPDDLVAALRDLR